MIARPVRIDVDTRSGKRRDVAAAWRRLEDLAGNGYAPDGAGGWTYTASKDWVRIYAGTGRHPDGPVSDERAARMTAYVTHGGAYTPR